MGTLKVNKIDLNNVNVMNDLKSTIQKLINMSCYYYSLRFKSSYYFQVPNGLPPSEKGWYIILNGKTPIYVGKADNLNARLNTDNGSIDNFANSNRDFDLERNFIKKFAELGIFKELRVCILLEKELKKKLPNLNNLTDLDRANIEKLINIFRCHFTYR